jgi:hypothetical protein
LSFFLLLICQRVVTIDVTFSFRFNSNMNVKIKLLLELEITSGILDAKTKADLRKTKTFKKIENDIKLKRKLKEAESKSGSKKETGETYVDKDRAIAVVIGESEYLNLS